MGRKYGNCRKEIFIRGAERRKQMEEEDGEKVVTDAPLKTDKLYLFRTILLHHIKAELTDY